MKKNRTISLMLSTALILICCVSYSGGGENADEWAQAVFDESLQKLANDGALSFQPEGYLFTYTNGVPFLNGDAAARYVDTPAAVDGKAIYCYWSPADGVLAYETESPGAQMPRHTPTWSDGAPLLEDVVPERFADSIDECGTLIVYGGFESSRSKDYYMDGLDRVGITTLVFVIGAEERNILHVEVIGTDTPGMTTEMSHTTGYTLHDEAKQYISGLLE